MKSTILLIILTIILVLAVNSQAQNKKNALTKTFSGLVMDCKEGRIPGVVVIVKNKNLRRRVVTNEWGGFEMNLPIGKYQLTVEATGKYAFFGKFQQDNLEIKTDSDFDIILGYMVPVIRDP